MPGLSQQIQLTNPFQVPILGHDTGLHFPPHCAFAACPRAPQLGHWGPSLQPAQKAAWLWRVSTNVSKTGWAWSLPPPELSIN